MPPPPQHENVFVLPLFLCYITPSRNDIAQQTSQAQRQARQIAKQAGRQPASQSALSQLDVTPAIIETSRRINAVMTVMMAPMVMVAIKKLVTLVGMTIPIVMLIVYVGGDRGLERGSALLGDLETPTLPRCRLEAAALRGPAARGPPCPSGGPHAEPRSA